MNAEREADLAVADDGAVTAILPAGQRQLRPECHEGGGKGAAIGAIIGGGAGAGSVIAQGRDDVQLFKGSTVTVQSSSPIRRDQPQNDN